MLHASSRFVVWEEAHGAGIATLFLRVGLYQVPSIPTIVEATMFEKSAARSKRKKETSLSCISLSRVFSCLCTLGGGERNGGDGGGGGGRVRGGV